MTASSFSRDEPSREPARPELPPQYDPASTEASRYEEWVARGYFRADASGDRPAYCIVIPPPNVTGSLHMGHAFEHTLMDALTRRRRMQGFEALWLPGMDHAGIATQNVVERELAKEGISRHDIGRERFLERVWEWKEQSGGLILRQMRRLGDAVDWSRERFTMDDGLSRAVQTIFKRLYDDGLIYRAERIINWCPRCNTALSDIEVDHSEDEGELVSIRYGPLVVATTRVETMLGDTGVAVHPDDERYRSLVDTEVELPLVGRMLKVVADEHVDPEFGTGAVKVTPAHDPNDFEIAQRHDLPAITVMDERGVITLPGPWEGLDRFEARDAIKRYLREQALIVDEKHPYVHAVGHCQRCDTVVEPRLSLQWFVKVGPLAKTAGDAVRDGRIRIHPPELAARYFDWVDDMHDWCISRQLWWGHRIPVWYDAGGEARAIGPDEKAPDGWTQDEDVLDTWFSSGLWPFSTLGWPEQTEDLARFYPTSVLVTGYDILFFWVVRMVMFGLYAMDGRPPFDVVALHGMVRDEHGKKMSKSFGNVVDPLDWIDRYGADALRFTLARGANPGTDVPIGEDWVRGSRSFVNKVWNASRFALMNGADARASLPDHDQLSTADRWILSRLAATIDQVDAYYEDFQFAKLCDALYHFAWDEFCDWYVELAKVPLNKGGAQAAATRAVLGRVLDALLRLLHPVVPFVTDHLWTALTDEAAVVVAPWPSTDDLRRDVDAEAQIEQVQSLVTEVRRFRAEQGLAPSRRVSGALLVDDQHPLADYAEHIGALTRVQPLAFAATAPDGWATITTAVGAVALDLAGAVDVSAERARLAKARAAAVSELEGANVKLGNDQFRAKAPAHVVQRIQQRHAEAEAEIARIDTQIAALAE